MLSSNRMPTTRAEEPDEETELWDSLRIEADRRSSEFPASRSMPPPVPPSARVSHQNLHAGYGTQQPSPFAVAYHGSNQTDEFAAQDYFEVEEASPDTSWAHGFPAAGPVYATPMPAAQPPAFATVATPGGFDAQAWARNFDPPGMTQAATALARPRPRLLWPAVAMASILGIAAAGYQFVLLPRQEQERTAALAALDAQQKRLLEEQRALQEANARAEEEKRLTQEAIERADKAAADAAAAGTNANGAGINANGGPKVTQLSDEGSGKVRSGSRRPSSAERRALRHERRAARAAERSRRRASSSDSDSARSSSSSSRRSKRAGSGEESDDPLFGL